DVGSSPGTPPREVPLVGEIWPLFVLHTTDQLRNHEVDVRVALPMAVRRHVHRHSGYRLREVGTVIEVESAQVVLIGFALAAVLGDHDAGDGLEHFAGAHEG